MSYELKKPITEQKRMDFISNYIYKQGLRLEDTEMFLFALEVNEIMGEKEIEIDVPEYDEEGNPIIIEYEDTETVIDYDEEGNPIGSHEITVIKHKQKTHIEKITIPYPVIDPNYEQEQIRKIKSNKLTENLTKAKTAIENGYITFKGAEFETNAQTVGDLTATMLLLQSTGQEAYSWLSRDDKVVELTVEDFASLGALIAEYKNTVWNEKYLEYKEAVENAMTVEALNKIIIDYTLGD